MGATHTVTVGNKGRIVVPVDVRERSGLVEGTMLVLLETPDGIVLLTRQQLRDRVHADLAGVELVESLLSERRAAALAEDKV